MIEVGISLLILGFCLALGVLAVKVVRQDRRIEDIEDRTDNVEDGLMDRTGWLP
jgi:hypothetical protein